MKEHSDNKVPLVRMSQDDPLDPPSTKNYQVDSNNNNLGESNMINNQVEVSQKHIFFRVPIPYMCLMPNTYNLVLNGA